MLKFKIVLLCMLTYLTACEERDSNVSVDADGWMDLFNGKNLDGWKRLNGSAEFVAKDGIIIGATKRGEPNTFLATKDTYRDFILELEFLGDPFINSGIQIRSNSTDYQGGKVHGYQVDLDPSERAWTGGIYDESRRGWLYPMGLNPSASKAFKPKEWNKIYVEAIGNEIRTWVNDVPAAYLIDDMTQEGFIALQIHSIDRADLNGRLMQWRNIRLKTTQLKKREGTFSYIVNTIPNHISAAEKAKGWMSLFDGNTNQWRGAQMKDFPQKGWNVKDGVLSTEGSSDPALRGGDILTRDEFSSFEFELEFKLTRAANSGIKYFVTEAYDQSAGSAIGLEYQIIDDAGYIADHGPLTNTQTLGALYDLIPPTIPPAYIRPSGEWNHLRIVSRADKTVEHWLNHIKVLDYRRGSSNYISLVRKSKFKGFKNFGLADQGHILLQDHGGAVSFRSIQVRNIVGK